MIDGVSFYGVAFGHSWVSCGKTPRWRSYDHEAVWSKAVISKVKISKAKISRQ